MKIILFRHGPAGSGDAARWPDDSLRPLTSEGEERTRAAAQGLCRLEGEIELVLTSRFERAERTARILAETADNPTVETLEDLEPGGSYRQIVAHLKKLKPDITVALVGHEPDLGKLAGTLLIGAPAALSLKKSGACVIDFVGPVEPGTGELIGFYPPRALRKLAGKKSKV
jgi:phosphohistidine phosphatase